MRFLISNFYYKNLQGKIEKRICCRKIYSKEVKNVIHIYLNTLRLYITHLRKKLVKQKSYAGCYILKTLEKKKNIII